MANPVAVLLRSDQGCHLCPQTCCLGNGTLDARCTQHSTAAGTAAPRPCRVCSALLLFGTSCEAELQLLDGAPSAAMGGEQELPTVIGCLQCGNRRVLTASSSASLGAWNRTNSVLTELTPGSQNKQPPQLPGTPSPAL